MKKWKPEFKPEQLETCGFSVLLERLRSGEYDIDGCCVTDGAPGEADLYGVSFTRCLFRRCRFTGAELGQCSFVDAVFESCDFSNTSLGESFFQRCELTDCRLTGARLDSARFRQVRMQGCAAGYAGLDRARFDRVEFEKCDFDSADLRACQFKEISASGCRFMGTNFYQTMLAGVDFTSSDIGGWTLSEQASELRGAIVTPIQAVELAGRLGLVVRDEIH